VHAYTDLNADNVPDPGSDPDGGPELVFDFPLDLTMDPSTYRPAAVTNLFYWNNLMHDVTYRYGFNEVSGNFQVNQYGRGGLGNDDVRAEAQDGSGTNNANFFTPTDGARPRMQMFIWNSGQPFAVIVEKGPAAGVYPAAGAAFGPSPLDPPVSGVASLATDDTAPDVNDGCEPLVGFPAGQIAFLNRGNCNFTVKVANAQAAGAVAVIVVNNVPGNPGTMGGADPTIRIPSVMVRQENGQFLIANSPIEVVIGANPDRPVSRDSDLDAGVIAHEYGHGISNRLTGGPTVVGCLNNAEQMGEGWSDFMALIMTAKGGQTGPQPRGIGNYVSFRDPDGPGIRPAPYSTDMTVNPVTYGALGTLAIPHGVGYAWNSMLWEVYWNLVEKHGFNPDIYGAWSTGGNNLTVQLVIDGMKLQVCRPGFVDGRDAILMADQALTGGANQCAIWKGFAKRGLGFSASQGLNTSTTDGTEAFDLPAACLAAIAVSPTSISATQTVNSTRSHTLTISNTAAADGTDLEWTITEAPESCDAPADLPWASVSPASGTTDAAGSSAVTVTFDTHGLAVGTYTGKLCIASNAGATPVEVPLSLSVIYDFRGFFFPVANPPAVNRVIGGLPVLLRFSLGGDFGNDVAAPGSPTWQQYNCTTGAPIGAAESALDVGPVFVPIINQYLDIVATRITWHNTCRRLTLTLDDGTSHSALFRFR
jgi:extracellular elastinolytic metalloproteinase